MPANEHGKLVGALPPKGNINTDYDESVILAQQHPNEAVEVATNLSVITINSVRQYVERGRQPYVTGDGYIEVSCRDSKAHEDGKRYGTMYFRWIPNNTKRKR